MNDSPSERVDKVLDHLFRHHAGQLIAKLTRIFGIKDLDLVEDVVQDAFLAALRTWPYRGIPNDAVAWIVRVARNRALDILRRRAAWSEREQTFRQSTAVQEATLAVDLDSKGEIRDDQLRMIFACCHDAISRDAQVALTLKTVGGFSVPEIARAFLARDATVAQRLVRAKRKLVEAGVELEIPSGEELPRRLDAVLEVLYLMFNEGYHAHEGEDLIRRDLCQEAIRLCELLSRHPLVNDHRVHALAALMLFQGSRIAARVSDVGDALLLADQNRELWDRRMIERGFWYLGHAGHGEKLSRYHLEAEIAACHAASSSDEQTEWNRILECYDALCRINPTPITALNRVVALARVSGPTSALAALEEIEGLERYSPYHGLRGKLLADTGQLHGAIASYQKALSMPLSAPVRRHIEKQLNELTSRLPRNGSDSVRRT